MKKIFLEVSTHWDREWYVPFEEYRYKLVRVMNGIVSELESGEHIDRFMLDGQTVVLEDYLAIVPEMRGRIEALIRSGKLKIGPWYDMPDEHLVSGESLVANLLRGREVCRTFGTDGYRSGYINDLFGHVAQFPQILSGFGIKMAYLGRGVGGKGQKMKHFVWTSPAGDVCLAYKSSYARALNRWKNFLKTEHSDSEKNDFIRSFLDGEFEVAGNGIILLAVTNDHNELDETTLDFIRRLNSLDGYEIMTDGFEAAFDELDKDKGDRPEIPGELITPSFTPDDLRFVTDVASSYYPLKLHNDLCQNRLETDINAMYSFDRLNGGKLNVGFLREAYGNLLKNHPHDSICGCSADRVHKDMEYRFDQVDSITSAIISDFMSGGISTDNKGTVYLSVFNPAPYKRVGVLTAGIELSSDFGDRDENGDHIFSLTDKNRKDVPYQIMSVKRNVEVPFAACTQNLHKADRYVIRFEGTLQPFGFTVFNVNMSAPRVSDRLSSGENFIDNGLLRVTAMPDGIFTVLDRKTGKTYTDLLSFTDIAENGNGWFHIPPKGGDGEVSFCDASHKTEGTVCGELEATLTTVTEKLIPAYLDYDSGLRSDKTVPYKIVTEVSLKKGEKGVFCTLTVQNNAKDHVLKMKLPTGIKNGRHTVSQAFCFVDRHDGIAEDTLGGYEPEQVEKPFGGVILKQDENGHGLALCGAGGIRQAGADTDGTVSVILLRSFGHSFMQYHPTRCQIQGEQKFCFALVPLDKDTKREKLLDICRYSFRTENAFSGTFIPNDTNGLVSVFGDGVAVSTVKPSDDGRSVILRLFGVGNAVSTAFVTLSQKCEVTRCRLDETDIEALPESAEKFAVSVRTGEIVSLRITKK